MSKSGLTSLLSQSISQPEDDSQQPPSIIISGNEEDAEPNNITNDASLSDFASSFSSFGSSLGATPAGTPACTPIKPSPLSQMASMASTPNTIQNALSGLENTERQRAPSFTSGSPGGFLNSSNPKS